MAVSTSSATPSALRGIDHATLAARNPVSSAPPIASGYIDLVFDAPFLSMGFEWDCGGGHALPVSITQALLRNAAAFVGSGFTRSSPSYMVATQ